MGFYFGFLHVGWYNRVLCRQWILGYDMSNNLMLYFLIILISVQSFIAKEQVILLMKKNTLVQFLENSFERNIVWPIITKRKFNPHVDSCELTWYKSHYIWWRHKTWYCDCCAWISICPFLLSVLVYCRLFICGVFVELSSTWT